MKGIAGNSVCTLIGLEQLPWRPSINCKDGHKMATPLSSAIPYKTNLNLTGCRHDGIKNRHLEVSPQLVKLKKV